MSKRVVKSDKNTIFFIDSLPTVDLPCPVPLHSPPRLLVRLVEKLAAADEEDREEEEEEEQQDEQRPDDGVLAVTWSHMLAADDWK